MARSRAAEARLDAVAAAKRLHRELALRESVATGMGMVDVFGVIEQLGIPLIFKPLKSALGLCLPKPLSGIMVTTRRTLPIQRFTAAHELGHAILDHSGSVDHEFNYRTTIDPNDGRDVQEIAADAFAAEFLLPRWLYKYHVQKQGWTVARHLRNPEVVYQLSLRMGVSYEATCWGLLGHQILKRPDVEALAKTKVASIKSDVSEEFQPSNSWANAWRISQNDDGSFLRGSHEDLVRIDLQEAAGSGFQWNVEDLRQAGFEILSDENLVQRDPIKYGASVQRTLIARPPNSLMAKVNIAEHQPWTELNDDDRQLSVVLDLAGKEAGGWSRAARTNRGAVTK